MRLAHGQREGTPVATFNPKAKGVRGSSFAAALVRLRGISAGANNTAILIYEYVNSAQGAAWPSEARMAGELGVRRDTISRHIKELVAAGVIVVNPMRHAGGRFGSNAYAFAWRPEYASILLPDAEPVNVADEAICAPSASVLTVLEKSNSNEGDSVDRSESDIEPSLSETSSGLEHRARGSEPERRRQAEGVNDIFPRRPTDEENPVKRGRTNESHRRETTKPTTWQPTLEDAGQLLALMIKKTGAGDIGFAFACLALVKRGAESIDDVLTVVDEKVKGSHVKNNGYIRAVIADHFGELHEQRAEREAAERRALMAAKDAEEAYRAALKHALSVGDMDEHLRLTKLQVRGWMSEQQQVAA